MKSFSILGLLIAACFLMNCDGGTTSSTMTLSFYATEDPNGTITVYIDNEFAGEINHYSTDVLSVDCTDSRWPKEYLGLGDYFIEYHKNGARYASQNYTVTSSDLGACIPLLAYP